MMFGWSWQHIVFILLFTLIWQHRFPFIFGHLSELGFVLSWFRIFIVSLYFSSIIFFWFGEQFSSFCELQALRALSRSNLHWRITQTKRYLTIYKVNYVCQSEHTVICVCAWKSSTKTIHHTFLFFFLLIGKFSWIIYCGIIFFGCTL